MGFLRSTTALIQTIGRAARNVRGRVVMYADGVTDAMRRAIDETNRRREIQMAYNEEHGIEPSSIIKEIHTLSERLAVAEKEPSYYISQDIPDHELERMIAEIEEQMKAAAEALEFEKAALLRDQMLELRRAYEGTDDLPEWERIRRERQRTHAG